MAKAVKVTKKFSDLETAVKNSEAKASQLELEKLAAEAKFDHISTDFKNLKSDYEVKCLENVAQAAEIKRLKFEKAELQRKNGELTAQVDKLVYRNFNSICTENGHGRFVEAVAKAAGKFRLGFLSAMMELDCYDAQKRCLDIWDGRKPVGGSLQCEAPGSSAGEVVPTSAGEAKVDLDCEIPCPNTPEQQEMDDVDELSGNGLKIRNTESEDTIC